jgi:hypothetical protein
VTAPTAGVEERELVRRMLAMLVDFSTTAGHLAMRVPQEHMGVCTGRRSGCAASCREWGELLELGTLYLNEHPEMPAQPPLWAETEVAS